MSQNGVRYLVGAQEKFVGHIRVCVWLRELDNGFDYAHVSMTGKRASLERTERFEVLQLNSSGN